jgi:hypothetical protein
MKSLSIKMKMQRISQNKMRTYKIPINPIMIRKNKIKRRMVKVKVKNKLKSKILF